MPSPGALVVFCAAAALLAIVPGPAVTYVVTQSVERGRKAGLISVLGVGTGGLVHVAAATIGLSALIASSANAFTIVKFAGAIYLIVLGIQRLLGRADFAPTEEESAKKHRRVYIDGVVVNILNPKTALFFLAFLPQFVDPDAGSTALQIAFLGVLFVLIAMTSDAIYAVGSAALASRLRRSERAQRIQRYVSGVIFIGLGAFAATAKRT
jgi:threonine/homoserine/homoserine lactone efflux protein